MTPKFEDTIGPFEGINVVVGEEFRFGLIVPVWQKKVSCDLQNYLFRVRFAILMKETIAEKPGS